VVGALRDEVGAHVDQGAAYVFERRHLAPQDPATGQRFDFSQPQTITEANANTDVK
jgi:hypothetical protein